MGFFTKPDQAPAPVLAPLSHERITGVLDANETNYGVDSDGDIGGYWDGHLFYFFRVGDNREIFQVRGRWNRKVGVDQRPQLNALVNDWNADKLWPKAYTREEDGLVGVYGELAVDYEPGVTDDQIFQQLSCVVATTLQLFDHLDAHYPAQAAAAREEFEQD